MTGFTTHTRGRMEASLDVGRKWSRLAINGVAGQTLGRFVDLIARRSMRLERLLHMPREVALAVGPALLVRRDVLECERMQILIVPGRILREQHEIGSLFLRIGLVRRR